MIVQLDPHPLIAAHLAAAPEVEAIVGGRIWAGVNTPPKGYEPTAGAAIVFRVRGGLEDYSPHYARPSVQVKCYAAAGQAAYGLALTVQAVLRQPIAGLPTGRPESLPQILNEENGWPMAAFFYEFLSVSPMG